MSVYWNLKRKTDKKYIVIQHPLKIQHNATLCGVKFCGGYGVVAEKSKEYRNLKKIPMFKKAKELPLSFLKKAGFRLRDIQLVFGNDIYYHYLDTIGLSKQLEPIEKEVEQPFADVKVEELVVENLENPEIRQELDNLSDSTELPELTTDDIINVHLRDGLCVHMKADGTICSNKKSMASPSGYCFGHIRYDVRRAGANN